MLVYRIATTRYAHSLTASGYPARWNPENIFMLYTAATRSLACLENLVHRSGIGLTTDFRTMILEIPDHIYVENVNMSGFPADWQDIRYYNQTQAFGEKWVLESRSAVLRVPSAIVPEEFNFLLNVQHPQFANITLVRTEPFLFDLRLKTDPV
jgi:RES domain-containing protein